MFLAADQSHLQIAPCSSGSRPSMRGMRVWVSAPNAYCLVFIVDPLGASSLQVFDVTSRVVAMTVRGVAAGFREEASLLVRICVGSRS
jgi:hypothetical protein